MRRALTVASGIAALTTSPLLADPVRGPIDHVASGRFQIYFGPFARADAYLLDSETGRVWVSVIMPDGSGAWQEQSKFASPPPSQMMVPKKQ